MATDNLALKIFRHLRKIFPKLEVPPSVASIVHTDSVTLLSPSSYYNGFKRLIRRLESGKSQSVVVVS
jgi:hypothetical protein